MVDQTHRFPVVLEPEAEGGFTVRVPSLPEIVTYGADEKEALSMAKDAIRLVLEDCIARGELAQIALEIEARRHGVYHATAKELQAIDEALAAVSRGDIASDVEVEAVFAKYRRA